MINRMRLTALILLWVPFFGHANSQNASLPLGQRSVTKPHIYQVTSPRGVKSYLFGSFHHGIGVEQLPHWLRRLHQNAELHAYELMAIDFNTFKSLQQLNINPEEAMQTLKISKASSDFSEEEIDKLVAAGIPRPLAWRLSENSCSKFIFRTHFFNQTFKSLDYEFMLYSLKFNRPILELENDAIREEAAKLDPPSSGCSIKSLIASPIIVAQVDRMAKEMEEKYLSGREIRDDEYGPDDASVFYRNHVWVEKLKSVLSFHRSFITVGFLHLHGKEGLINLLKLQGFQVERVTADPGDTSEAHHNFQR